MEEKKMSKGTLKKVMGTVAMTLIGISCYSCSENNIPMENSNYTPVRTGNNIQIVSGIIPAPTEATTTTVVNDDDSYIVRINNMETTAVTTPAEKAVVTTVTTVNDSAMLNQATNTNTAQTYNETGNSPIIWKNGYQYYIVQSGDSWSSIAAYLDVDVVQLAAANNCSVYDVLYIGDELFIPNEYVDYTQQSNNYTPDSSYTQSNTNSYTNQMSGTCLSSVTLYSAPDTASWNNIEVSLGTLNGMTLAAGETFNWDNYIGWQTINENYGYMDAAVLVGTDVGSATGGGVCVTSTALFQAARDAGMAIYERHDHSRSVSYATPGNEASVSYGCMNLIFNNTTGYDVVFYTSCYYGSVTVSCYIA
jgi:LysM repeat protein